MDPPKATGRQASQSKASVPIRVFELNLSLINTYTKESLPVKGNRYFHWWYMSVLPYIPIKRHDSCYSSTLSAKTTHPSARAHTHTCRHMILRIQWSKTVLVPARQCLPGHGHSCPLSSQRQMGVQVQKNRQRDLIPQGLLRACRKPTPKEKFVHWLTHSQGKVTLFNSGIDKTFGAPGWLRD